MVALKRKNSSTFRSTNQPKVLSISLLQSLEEFLVSQRKRKTVYIVRLLLLLSSTDRWTTKDWELFSKWKCSNVVGEFANKSWLIFSQLLCSFVLPTCLCNWLEFSQIRFLSSLIDIRQYYLIEFFEEQQFAHNTNFCELQRTLANFGVLNRILTNLLTLLKIKFSKLLCYFSPTYIKLEMCFLF